MQTWSHLVRFKRLLAKLAITVVALLVAVLACEFLLRLFVNPADYLAASTVKDDVLGARIPANAGGFDEWGFRNKAVPETAEIVAIGDSHTYGNCAKMMESWPLVLGQLCGKSVYNLGLGGYGPNQYYHLLVNKALSLEPSLVVCGLYMGDDLENAFRITYGLQHWSYLREKSFQKDIDPDIWNRATDEVGKRRFASARNWLSQNSISYRLLFHGSLVGMMKGKFQIEHASTLYGCATCLVLDEMNVREAFIPEPIALRLDQTNDGVREGMRIALELFAEMNSACRERDVRFLVVIIPTKEFVFEEFLRDRTDSLPLGTFVQNVIDNERQARLQIVEFFDERNIEYVDSHPRLQSAAGTERLYANSATDMHPNNNGYRVIAEAIAEYLGCL